MSYLSTLVTKAGGSNLALLPFIRIPRLTTLWVIYQQETVRILLRGNTYVKRSFSGYLQGTFPLIRLNLAYLTKVDSARITGKCLTHVKDQLQTCAMAEYAPIDA